MSENECFNIYYLNLDKVYEISMMMDNQIVTKIERENTNSSGKTVTNGLTGTAEYEFSKQLLGSAKSSVSAEIKNTYQTNSSERLFETIEVKTTKSILLSSIIDKAKTIEFGREELEEGKLVKIDHIKLKIVDEELLRQVLMIRRDALEGLKVEGLDVNAMLSSVLQDYSYVLYSIPDDKSNNKNIERILLKIPLEVQNEFESKYHVDDLLIGHVSVIGICKGDVKLSQVQSNIFNYYAESSTNKKQSNGKIIESADYNNSNPTSQNESPGDNEKDYKFIDVIAIIQDVKFNEETHEPSQPEKTCWFKRLIQCIKHRFKGE